MLSSDWRHYFLNALHFNSATIFENLQPHMPYFHMSVDVCENGDISGRNNLSVPPKNFLQLIVLIFLDVNAAAVKVIENVFPGWKSFVCVYLIGTFKNRLILKMYKPV